MIEKQMLKLLLGKKFYTQYKGQVSRNVFQGSFGSLFETIQKAHDKYDADISVDELYSLHTAIYNPALTRAAKEQFSELIEDIKETTEPSEAIAKDIVAILSDRNTAQQIAIESTEIFNGKPADFNIITKIDSSKKNVIELCINKSKPFIYTSALPTFLVDDAIKRFDTDREVKRKNL